MRVEDRTFDYIVVGAGTSGCVVAARLSEDGRYSVLLLEAGEPDADPRIEMPAGFLVNSAEARPCWQLTSEPEKQLNGRRLHLQAGKVLGGTSSINGMVYLRGQHADYDEWRKRGCIGWDWKSVLPYFKKAEDQQRGPDDFHGIAGPVGVSDLSGNCRLASATVEAMVSSGIPFNSDFNGIDQAGCGYYQSMMRKGRRASAASAYLAPARKRRNLAVETQAHATRILFEKRRATAVEWAGPKGRRLAQVVRDVVVCCGAYGTPHLLQLSGLGPAEILRRSNVPVVCDMPAVGANLQDHFSIPLVFRCAQPVTVNDLELSGARRLAAKAEYASLGRGPLANGAVYAGAFVRSCPAQERPDLQISLRGWATDGKGGRLAPYSAFTLSVTHLTPRGRGEIRVRSADPNEQASIRLDTLKTEYDLRAMLAGIRLGRQIATQPALAGFVAGEVAPGPSIGSVDQLTEEIRLRGGAAGHAVGTCRMGTAADCVVDPRLKVHGIERLRVADASIMPVIVAGDPAAATIMIGEKAADIMLEDAQHLR